MFESPKNSNINYISEFGVVTMRRRFFMKQGAGALAAGLFASAAKAVPTTGLSVTRITRLFANPGGSRYKFIQDIQVSNQSIYCLHVDSATRTWSVTVSDVADNIVSTTGLQKGIYTAIAVSGTGVLVHALSGQDAPNCIVRVNLADGAVQNLGSFDQGAGPSRVVLSGNRVLLLRPGRLQSWVIDDSALVKDADWTGPFSERVNIDALSDAAIAFTARDGSGITTIKYASDQASAAPLRIPEVINASRYYQAQVNETSGRPVVIPATGSDGSGKIYGIVLPSPPSAVQCAEFDVTGTGSIANLFTFPPRKGSYFIAPMKLLIRPAEFGIVFNEGNIAWYPRTGNHG